MKLSELSLSNASPSRTSTGALQSSLDPSHTGHTRIVTSHMHSSINQPKTLNESNNAILSNALSASQLFQEKLKNESQVYYQHKTLENKIRSDIGKSTDELLARTQMIESKYIMDAKEANAKWEAAMALKEEEIKSLKQSFEQTLEKKDAQWKSILIDCETKARREMESYKDRLNLENEAKEMASLAKIEANKERVQMFYDKKLRKYEKQVALIIERFEDKKMKYEGALEEVRRQLRESSELSDKKATYLHEEVVIKEKRITSMLGKLQQFNSVASELSRWRDIAKELATMVVNTSLQVLEMPAVESLTSGGEASLEGESAIDEALRAFFTSNEKSSSQNAKQSEYYKRIKDYKAMKKANVLLSKKCLSRLTKCSKRIIEESEISKNQADELFNDEELGI